MNKARTVRVGVIRGIWKQRIQHRQNEQVEIT